MKWTRKQQAYQRIIADPGDERDREQIAQHLNVATATLESWEKKEGFWLEVNKFARAKAERTLASVWSALSARARRGEVSAIKLLFSLLGLSSEPEEQDHKPVQFKLVVENGNGSTTITADSPKAYIAQTGDLP